MPHYSVELNGTNILIPIEGVEKKLGFVTVRIVESENSSLAKQEAIKQILEMDEYQRSVSEKSLTKPLISVGDVEQILDEEAADFSNTALIFYEP